MSITAESVNLKPLVTWLHNHPGPHDLDDLVHRAAELMVETSEVPRVYSPTASYAVGERLWIEGDVAELVAVRHYHNPPQGRFAVLELAYANGLKRRIVADLSDATEGVADDMVARLVRHRGGEIRRALLSDPTVAEFIQAKKGAPQILSTGLEDVEPLRDRRSVGRAAGLFAEPILQTFDSEVSDDDEVAVRRRFSTLHAAWLRARQAGRPWSLAETWEGFVQPALEVLGWLPLALSETGCYALFSHREDRDRAADLLAVGDGDAGQSCVARVEGAAVLLKVVPWDYPLGYALPDVPDVSPAIRMVGDLRVGGWDWGILTDGSCWRLYRSSQDEPKVGSAASEYQQLDLARTFDFVPPSGEFSAAQYSQLCRWLHIFCAGTFLDGPDHASWIEHLLSASAAYLDDVVVQLRDRLLTSVLPEIAGGFIAYRYQHLGVQEEDDVARREIIRASFGLVYRLLFLLSGEYRHLMPLHNPDYRGQSLTTLLRWAAESLDQGLPLSPALHMTPRYDALLRLFRSLEHGEPSLELPSYTDGLFNPVDPDQSFLERHRLSDRVVARVLDALARLDGTPIDYAALTVRHLSAIAEGLLETMLWVVEAPAGMVALLNHQGEYQGVDDPVLTDDLTLARLAATFEAVMEARGAAFARAMERIVALKQDGVLSQEEERTLRELERATSDALLDVKILDPAMGAGSFLVAAVDLWTDNVIQLMVAYHRTHPEVPWSWNPVYRAVVDERRRLLDEIEHQGFVIHPGFLSDATVLARLVIQHAIYGIDLNPVAVALSKTTLRMRAFAVGVPFPYLDAHLQRGNSLLGTWIEDLAASSEPAISTLASRFVTLVADTSYELAMRDALLPYEALLDLWAGQAVVASGEADEVRRLARVLARFLRTGRSQTDGGEVEVAFARAETLREHYHFVHWDLVYPEVFLGARQRQDTRLGFDLVIGCPPQVRFGAAAGQVRTAGESAFLALGRRLLRKPYGCVAFIEATPRVLHASRLSDTPSESV